MSNSNRAIAPEAYKAPAGRPAPDLPAATTITPPKPQPPTLTMPLHGPWPSLAVFGQRWTGPARPPTPAAVGVLALAAVIAAVSLPLDRGGLGWLVAVLAGVGALATIRHLPQRRTATDLLLPQLRQQTQRSSRARYAWAAATVALLGVGTLRAAGWLVLLCLATAVVTGALAVAGGRSMRTMITAVLFSMFAPFRALPWVHTGLDALRRRSATGANRTRVAATIATAVALLVVFGTLFASADENFARLLERAIPSFDVPTLMRYAFVFFAAGGVLGGSAYLRSAPPPASTTDGKPTRTVSRFEWAFPLAALVLLFAAFVAVQLTALFGGFDHVMQTADLTFADYARGGFWQLLAVTGLTLAVLAGAARWAPRATRTDRVLIRSVLGALAGLTLIIVASALHKMNVYADTYGLTRMRLLVALCEFWLGAIFVMVLAAGIRLRAAWLPRLAVAIGVLSLLGLAAINPDGVIADRNVTRFEQSGRIDTEYLSELSGDAVPALDRLTRLSPRDAECIRANIQADLNADPDDWRGWSYGRSHARDLLAEHPPIRPANCQFGYRY